ncbi:MAG: hypothetical protein U0527_09840 [Candidatus Eisenbacteria bacterium]
MPPAPSTRPRLAALALSCLALQLAACTPSDRTPPAADDTYVSPFPAAYVDSTAELSPLRFADGTVSLNDRCPVRRGHLNRRMPPVYVNGRPVGFC